MNRLAIIERQADLLRSVIRPHVDHGTPYSLVDFPAYANVGDSAIWLGAIALLRELTGRAPAYVCSKTNYDPAALRSACPTGPIFILGGGNFGDLWPGHQALRIRLMEQHPDRRIIQLPQSIQFWSPAEIEASADAISRHGDFILLVRDQASETFARDAFSCPVMLAPDCAFMLGPLERSRAADDRHLFLLRTDLESTGANLHPVLELGGPVVDWVAEDPLPQALRWRSALQSAASGGFDRNSMRVALYERQARHRLARGVELLSRGEVVVTDRLHAHILSILLDIPDVALDNHYGKVSGYHRLWLSDLEGSCVVDDAIAARDAALQLSVE